MLKTIIIKLSCLFGLHHWQKEAVCRDKKGNIVARHYCSYCDKVKYF